MKNLIMKNIFLILYVGLVNLGYGQYILEDCENEQETYTWAEGNIYV